MNSQQDIRWLQRLENYEKALDRLAELVERASEKELNDVERDALIHRFEYTQELSWKVIKDFFTSAGEFSIKGSQDAFKLAFQRNLLTDAVTLLQTIESRAAAIHSYNEEIAESIHHAVVDKYYGAFEELRQSLTKEKALRAL